MSWMLLLIPILWVIIFGVIKLLIVLLGVGLALMILLWILSNLF